jgi:hypothetical protein
MHIDDFIDRYTTLTKHATEAEREAERYARFVLSLLRYPAALRHDFEKFIPKLFCTWRGKRYEVTHASHHGYVGLTQEYGCGRVDERAEDALECSDWSGKP